MGDDEMCEKEEIMPKNRGHHSHIRFVVISTLALKSGNHICAIRSVEKCADRSSKR